MSGDILHDIDAAIEEHEDYVEWHGSADAATWTADGSHEVETGGHYYAEDESQVWTRERIRSWNEYMQGRVREMQAEDDWARAFTTTYDAIVDEAGRVSWQRLTEPDPAEFVRETVATWQPGPTPARPIEAVLRDIVRTQG